MRLTVVGCSGSLPGPGGAASCYLVEATTPRGVDAAGDGRPVRVLLDLGSGALGPLQQLVDLDDLDAVLLSHLHADHCLDLCGLHVARTYDPRGASRRAAAGPLRVHGPAGTAAHLAHAYGHGAEADLARSFDVRAWSTSEPLVLGPLVVEVAPARHPVEAYALRLTETATGRVLVYTGDTDSCAELEHLARGADLLLAEAAFQEGRESDRGVHLTGRRAADLARDAGVGRLLLTHLPPWSDPDVVLADAASSSYAGEVSLARPGLVAAL